MKLFGWQNHGNLHFPLSTRHNFTRISNKFLGSMTSYIQPNKALDNLLLSIYTNILKGVRDNVYTPRGKISLQQDLKPWPLAIIYDTITISTNF